MASLFDKVNDKFIGIDEFKVALDGLKKDEINKFDSNFRTCLHYACETETLKNRNQDFALAILKKQDVDVNVQDESKKTPLMHAIENGMKEVVLVLIAKKNIHLDLQDEKKKTALHYAIDKRMYEIATLLINKDCKLDYPDENELQPIHYAIRDDSNEIASLLIGKGCDVKHKDYFNKTNIQNLILGYFKLPKFKVLLE